MQELKRCPYCKEKQAKVIRSHIDFHNVKQYEIDSPLNARTRIYKCIFCGKHFEVKTPSGELRLIKIRKTERK